MAPFPVEILAFICCENENAPIMHERSSNMFRTFHLVLKTNKGRRRVLLTKFWPPDLKKTIVRNFRGNHKAII